MAALVAIFFSSITERFCSVYAKNSPKVLLFEKKYLLLRCILSKVKNNIN